MLSFTLMIKKWKTQQLSHHQIKICLVCSFKNKKHVHSKTHRICGASKANSSENALEKSVCTSMINGNWIKKIILYKRSVFVSFDSFWFL